jgi:hypothetical protein
LEPEALYIYGKVLPVERKNIFWKRQLFASLLAIVILHVASRLFFFYIYMYH